MPLERRCILSLFSPCEDARRCGQSATHKRVLTRNFTMAFYFYYNKKIQIRSRKKKKCIGLTCEDFKCEPSIALTDACWVDVLLCPTHGSTHGVLPTRGSAEAVVSTVPFMAVGQIAHVADLIFILSRKLRVY